MLLAAVQFGVGAGAGAGAAHGREMLAVIEAAVDPPST